MQRVSRHRTTQRKGERQRTREPCDGRKEEAHIAINSLVSARRRRRIIRCCDSSREERVREYPCKEYAGQKRKKDTQGQQL